MFKFERKTTIRDFFDRAGWLEEDLTLDSEQNGIFDRFDVGNPFVDEKLLSSLSGATEPEFALWDLCDQLIARSEILIDRPKGSAHPRIPAFIYPVDYGYLVGTTGGDGEGIDIYVGTGADGLRGYFATRDDIKQDREIKLLWNVTDSELEAIRAFLIRADLHPVLVQRLFPEASTG